MKKILMGLMILGSFSSYAKNCEVSIKLGFGLSESSELTAIILEELQSKGYSYKFVEDIKKGSQHLSLNVFGEAQTHNGEDFILARLIDDSLKTKGGYSIEHNIGGRFVEKTKEYKRRKNANLANYKQAVSNVISTTIDDCIH